MIEITKEKPCKYAEALGSDWYECSAYYNGIGCDNVVLDLNHDGTVNVANCGLAESHDCVIDKIRAEIEKHCGLLKENHCKFCYYCNCVMGVREILEILDKYKESEE